MTHEEIGGFLNTVEGGGAKEREREHHAGRRKGKRARASTLKIRKEEEEDGEVPIGDVRSAAGDLDRAPDPRPARKSDPLPNKVCGLT